MLRLIPAERRNELREHAVHVELTDTNDSYRVEVSKDGVSVVKTYLDTARDCASRENIAAVFAVLTVMPPEISIAPEPAAEPTPPAPTPTPTPTPTPRAAKPPAPAPALAPPLVRFELSGLGVAAPAIFDAPALAGLGGELRVAFGRRALALTLSVGYLSPARFALEGVQGDVTRLPASAGLRWHHAYDAWAVQLELGVLVASDRVRASNLLRSEAQHSFDAGVRAGLSVAPSGTSRLAPFAGVFAWSSVLSREIAVQPQGVIGNLPQLWLGGAVGVSVGL